MPAKIIPQEHRNAMVESYLAGATAREAASQFGYTTKACYFALRQRGITSRSNSETHRKYMVDETFFNTIDTEEKAYWLGFLTADGTIGGDHIILGLQERDIPQIHKFTASLHSNHPIIQREVKLKGKVYSFGQVHIGSLRLAQALKRLGVGERKSFVVCPCNDIPEHLLSHYWRGVFDGDGFIKRSNDLWQVGLVGNQEMVNGFSLFIQQSVRTETRVKPHFNIFAVSYTGIALPQSILALLYREATVFLDRKKVLFDTLMAVPIQRQNRSALTREYLQELYEALGTWKAVAAFLKTSDGRMYHIRKRVGLL